MKKRILELRLGDWSHDGHGLQSVAMVCFEGKDLSNDMFQRTFDNNVRRTGLHPFKEFEDFESNYLYFWDWKKLVDNGYEPVELESLPPSFQNPVFDAELSDDFDSNDELMSFPHLIMWYLTYGTDIEYTVMEIDTLFTGSSPVVKQESNAAYGLFMTP